ncbi:phytanoyl-CoA dioxygenase family protein [Aliiglaciecola lipolytica]|uniref:phytanoyl-CoA dioxygenase family protein n=1 Tax=Aliiglaciecola lipolytica TaxID=477689 RepID=UPI001C07FA94|nr:phytanoyl-CoA dioxygenase family protein [Aliiglaciecola lipolytica]MBU2878010.1 phytanoyl-CoA dioxygenase family protein [Aliiglaciecola lipolytica]
MSQVFSEFKSNGYYLAKNILDKSIIFETVDNIKKHFDNQITLFNIEPPADVFESMQLLHKMDIEQYKKTAASLWRKMSVYNLLHHPIIQNYVNKNFLIQDIVIPGGQVVLIQAESLRIPNGYFGLSAHQDFPSVNGSLDGFVVWVPLVDIDVHRYPLEIIPGSHLKGVYPTLENENSTWEIKQEYYSESDFLPVECSVGDVVFLSNFTIHRSSQKGDGRLRLACSTRYDNSDEKTFIKRGYPSAYIRTVDRSQFTKQLYK